MLAEPRRKIKYSIDPRNTNWANDDSKFGQKLLEKMGWSKGQGLGANKDGNPESVAVSIKNDNKGVGWNKKSEDNWIAHQDDFNSLLSSLNKSHGADKGSADEPESKKVQNLEQTSRSSRGRVHYQKFTKGKDLSLKTETDLDCVFGKRKSKSSEQVSVTQEDIQPTSDESEITSSLNTVTSSDSIQAYFAKKMAALKNKRNKPNITDSTDSLEHVKQGIDSYNVEMNGEEKKEEYPRSDTNKGKKRKYKDFEYSYHDDDITNHDEVEGEVTKNVKDKKKMKVLFSLGNDIVEPNSVIEEENSNDELSILDLKNKKKKKKSKKKRKELDNESKEGDDNEDQNRNDSSALLTSVNDYKADVLINSLSDTEMHIDPKVDRGDGLEQVTSNVLDETTPYLESVNNKSSKRKKSKKEKNKEKVQEVETAYDANAIRVDDIDTKCDNKLNKLGKQSKSISKKCDPEETDTKSSSSDNLDDNSENISEAARKNKRKKRKTADGDLQETKEKLNVEHLTESEMMTEDELVNPFSNRKPEKVLLEYANSNNLDVKFIMATTGPGHKPVHTMHVELGDQKFDSVQCGSKKEAKKQAAISALCVLNRKGELDQLNDKKLKEKEEKTARNEEKKKKRESKNKTSNKEETSKDKGLGSSYFPGSCLDNVAGYPGFDVKPVTELMMERKGKKRNKKERRRKQERR